LGIASQSHVLAAAMGIILIAVVAAGLFLPGEIVTIPGIGVTTVLFIAIYFFSVWLIYRYDKGHTKAPVAAAHTENISPKRAGLLFSVFALVVISCALPLPYLVGQIAEIAGLHKSFAGTLLLAASTSLPEIAVSVAAVRIGAIDMSVGNLLGSNLFNIFILALDDIFYTQGELLNDASDVNLISCLSTIIMSAVAIIGLIYRVQSKRYLLAWDALLIFLIYFANMLVLYRLTV
jgi:cation:H+ antiporter